MEVALSASSTDPTIYVWDVRSGSIVFSFKNNMSLKGGLALVPRPGATLQTGAILAAQSDRAVLNVYSWERDQVLHKMIMPEKMVSVAASHNGAHAAAATASGRVYLWHVATGQLLRTFDAHYRRVTRMAFSGDDTVLLTAGDDAVINVWQLAHLAADHHTQNDTTRITPLYSWSDHTLPISDMFLASGGIGSARVYTASLDHTVKLWDLATGTLLTTFLFPKPVSTVTVDPSESLLFAACEDKIYSVALYKRRQHHGYGGTEIVESVGGMGRVEAVGIRATPSRGGEESESATESVFTGHAAMITSLSLSFDASLLISASEDGQCMVWDVASRQLLRKFEAHKGPVSFVSCFLRPSELQTGATGQKSRPMAWKPFKRALVSQEEERRIDFEQALMDTTLDMKKHQHNVEAGPPCAELFHELDSVREARDTLQQFKTEDSSTSLQSRVTALQAELGRLADHHAKVKSLHNDMYNTLVDRFIADRQKRALQKDD